MGQANIKVRNDRLSIDFDSEGRIAKSGRKQSGRSAKKNSTQRKKRSNSLRRRFSKKSKHSEEDRGKRLIRDDSLSLASVDTIESRRIKITALSGTHFGRRRVVSFDSLSEYSAQGYRNSLLLFATNSSLDQDPELPDQSNNITCEEDTTKPEHTEVQTFKDSSAIESQLTLELVQDHPVLGCNETIESSSSVQLSSPQVTEGREMLAKKDSEVSVRLDDTQLCKGSANVDSTKHPTPVFIISASCASLATDLKEQPRLSFSGASMDDVRPKKKRGSGSRLSLLSRMRSPLMSDKRKTSVHFQEDVSNEIVLKAKARSHSLGDVRLVYTS